MKNRDQDNNIAAKIDAIVTHKIWGMPIFFFIMFLIFEATFSWGAYPMEWIEIGVEKFGHYIESIMNGGPLKDLIVDGVIGGVGGVIVFLPNILILYLLISIMEESGYMTRAAMVMDKSMQKIGLHGKSFIPLVMGFGCNVPAIMATDSIENRSSRLITIFVNPFISCSARLPVYILLAGAFFPEKSSLVLFCLYLTGIILAIITAIILRKFLFNSAKEPFNIEHNPYKLPSIKNSLSLMWGKAWQYIRKMGGLILVASIIVWFLSYFPQNNAITKAEQQEQSYMGVVGKFCEPVTQPLGLNWKANVALISGVAAKELIISTLGVLYHETGHKISSNLSDELTRIDPKTGLAAFTPLSALSFMIFVLIYFPCIASLAAIASQSGSWKWALASMLYSTILAWALSLAVYQIGKLFI